MNEDYLLQVFLPNVRYLHQPDLHLELVGARRDVRGPTSNANGCGMSRCGMSAVYSSSTVRCMIVVGVVKSCHVSCVEMDTELCPWTYSTHGRTLYCRTRTEPTTLALKYGRALTAPDRNVAACVGCAGVAQLGRGCETDEQASPSENESLCLPSDPTGM